MTPATPAAASPRYHHGDLPNVLRSAAAEVLAERGVAGFSLREVARRAGVSHAAPAHHFGDGPGLLTAVAIEAFDYLASETAAAAADVEDPVEALARIARAYVTMSIEHPGHCAIVFRSDAVRVDDPAYHEAGQRAFGVLLQTVERLAAQRAPDLDVGLAAALCWSAVEGLGTVHGPLSVMAERDGGTVVAIGDLAEQLTHLMVHGLVGHD